LRINIDYIIYDEKVEAGNGFTFRKEYVLDARSAKHIAMMTQGNKAEAVRDYFCMLEEQYELLMQNSNIHELSGRVGGLTRSNNELKKGKNGTGTISGTISRCSDYFIILQNAIFKKVI